MKRSLSLFLLLLIAGGFYFYLEQSEDAKLSSLKADRAFKLERIDELYKIVITEKNKKSIILDRKSEDSWLLNNKYLARKNAMDNLLEVVQQLEIKYIPETAALNNIISEMKTIGVQVDLYNKSTELIKSYHIGGATQDERGTYMMMNNAEKKIAQPFVMQIPSIEGSVRGRFILSETNWRDRSVVNENVDKINFVKVEYLGNQHESFIIKSTNKETQLFDQNGKEESRIDANKVKGYLQGFDGVYAEYIDNLNPLRDSIASLTPFSIISFGQSETTLKTIKLFPLSDLLYEQENENTESFKAVGGRYFVDCSWGDFMLVQHRLIGKLLRGKSFFEQI